MSNLLKNIFNAKDPEFGFYLTFKNPEVNKKFAMALNKISETGETIEINEESIIETYLNTNDIKQKTNKFDTVEKLIIGPSREKKPLTISTDYNNYTFNFEMYKTNDSIIFENNKSDVVYLKFCINDVLKQLKFDFKFNISIAKSFKELIITFNAVRNLFILLMNEPNSEIDKFIKEIKDTEDYWKIIYDVEQALGITFDNKKIPNNTDEIFEIEQSIYELYFLFVKKYKLKHNLNDLSITTSELNEKLIVNEKIGLSYLAEHEKELLGKVVSFKTQIFVPNAIISSCEKLEDGKYKLILSGTDINPLFSICQLYTPEENKESFVDFNNIELESIKTLSELIESL